MPQMSVLPSRPLATKTSGGCQPLLFSSVISAFSSDGRIAQYDLKILADPKGALPPYDAMLLLGPAHAHDLALIAALKPLIGAIPLNVMQQANLMVDRDQDKQTPAQAARWLAAHLMH